METVRDCLTATLESFEGRDLIIICDSREENTLSYLAQFAAERSCRLVQNLDPLGFQKSVAKGIRMSNAQYLVIVDSEVVPAAGCLRELVEHLSAAPRAEIAVPMLDVQLMRYFETSTRVSPVSARFISAANRELVAAALDSVTRGASFASTLESFRGHPCFALRRSAFSKLAARETAPSERTIVGKQEGVAKASSGVNLLAVPGSYACCRSSKMPEINSATLDHFDSPEVSGVLDALQSVLSSATRSLTWWGNRCCFCCPRPAVEAELIQWFRKSSASEDAGWTPESPT